MCHYVVFDLEMCRVPKDDKRRELGYRQEIIEIGAILLNESCEEIDRFKTYVKPEFGRMDARIEKLTGITERDITGAPSVMQALDAFTAWIPQDAVLVAWSENDEIQLRKELEVRNTENAELEAYLDSIIDCQGKFGERMESSKVYRLTEALTISDIDYDENIHDALVDAHNTALLFAKLQRETNLVLNRFYSKDESKQSTFSPFAALLAGYVV